MTGILFYTLLLNRVPLQPGAALGAGQAESIGAISDTLKGSQSISQLVEEATSFGIERRDKTLSQKCQSSQRHMSKPFRLILTSQWEHFDLVQATLIKEKN